MDHVLIILDGERERTKLRIFCVEIFCLKLQSISQNKKEIQDWLHALLALCKQIHLHTYIVYIHTYVIIYIHLTSAYASIHTYRPGFC